MRIAMVKLYDDYCHGPRCLQADLLQQGHEVYLINLKPFHMGRRGFGAFDPNLRREIVETAAWVEVQYDGEVFLPEHIEITQREREIFINLLGEIKPELICFSVTSDDAEVTAEFTRLAKEHFPDVMTVWGGVEISHEAAKYAKHADRMIRGEGEIPLRMLAEDPHSTEIPGLFWIDSSGKEHDNPLAPLIQDVDSLAWPTYGVNEFLIHDSMLHRITVGTHRDYLAARYIHMTGRGCPFKCAFCHHWKTHELYAGDKYMRRRSPKACVDQLEWAHHVLGVQSVMFWDDVFFMQPRWIEEFAAEFQSRLRFPIGGLAFPTMTKLSMFDQMLDSPLVCVGFGIQSGSEFVSNGLYNRGFYNDQIKDLAWAAHERGVEVTYDFLVHNPYESEDDVRASLRLLLDLPVPYNIITKRLFLYPNSPINALPYPRHNLSEETWQHYTMLMHLSRDPSVPREVIWDMAHNPHTKANPQISTAIVKSCLSRHNSQRPDPAAVKLADLNARKPMRNANPSLGRRILAKVGLADVERVGTKRQMPAEDGLMAH